MSWIFSLCLTVANQTAWNIGPFSIGPGTGRHDFKIAWEQQVGSTSLGQCNRTGSNPCTGTFTPPASGIQQSTFSAFEDGSAP